ncbi:HamA C-terminal domain-containing protein [Tabrizicola sp.]|uniref:HamA C-terminal domain-containing protein n=1 Tax=Tabrizicola sp. TaxID=2005166 RepID=UPI002FDD7D23
MSHIKPRIENARQVVSEIPSRFLEARCKCCEKETKALVLCAGYEGEAWRSKKLASHLFAWLPQVALDQARKDTFDVSNWEERIELAAAHVYRTKKTANRGEIGEILLHIACVQDFGTLPVLCKLVLKTSHNDTVKGFDAVHVVYSDDDFELWLGESKFYKDSKRGIDDAIKSIREHLLPTFLDTEKAMLYGHVPDHIPNAEKIRALFHKNTSSDILLKRSVFPVLVSYESKTVAGHKALSDTYVQELQAESDALLQYLEKEAVGIPIRIQVIFVPIFLKNDLIEHFDKKLEAFQ